MITWPWRGAGAALLAAVTAAGLASCGNAHAGQAAPSAPPVRLSLATSAGYPDGSWAVLVMGGSAAQHNNFWQVFVRPGQAGAWKLATPLGVASNGGITVAAEGGPALAAAIRPSQDLSFSPVASSSDNGVKWAQAGLLDAPLAGYPDALAAAPDGGLIALTRAGDVELRRTQGPPGPGWPASTPWPRQQAAAASRPSSPPSPTARQALRWWPVRAPGKDRPESSGWPAATGPGPGPSCPPRWPGGTSRCSRWPGRAGPSRRCWPWAAGRPPACSARGPTSDGTSWSLSQPYQASPARPLSAAFGGTPGTGSSGRGSLGVLLSGGRAASVSGPGAPWRSLPALPAGASSTPAGGATLAAAPGGFEALTARGSQLSVWALSSGSSAWDRSQVIKVAIPYGSSS